MNKIAVIQIRGRVNMSEQRKKTLDFLRLKRKNCLSVVNNSKEYIGMINKVKDYVTFGEIDEKTFLEVVKKRGELVGGKKVSQDKNFKAEEVSKKYFKDEIKLKDFEKEYNLKPYFRLNPPIGGFERGGIKKPFQKKGALGNRAEKIKDLIFKML